MPFSWRFSLEHPCSALSACPSPGGSHWSIPALHSLHALLLEVLTGASLLCTLCMPFSWRFSLEHPCSALSACPSPGGSHWSIPALHSLHALLLEVLTGASLLCTLCMPFSWRFSLEHPCSALSACPSPGGSHWSIPALHSLHALLLEVLTGASLLCTLCMPFSWRFSLEHPCSALSACPSPGGSHWSIPALHSLHALLLEVLTGASLLCTLCMPFSWRFSLEHPCSALSACPSPGGSHWSIPALHSLHALLLEVLTGASLLCTLCMPFSWRFSLEHPCSALSACPSPGGSHWSIPALHSLHALLLEVLTGASLLCTLCMPFSWRFSLEHPCSALSACPSPGGSHWSIPALHSLHALLLEVLTGASLLCTLCMPFSWRFSLEHPCSALSACPSPGGSHWSIPALHSLHALLLEVLTGASLLCTLCMPFSWRFSLEHPCSALSACPSPGGSHWSIPALHSLHALLLEVLTGASLLCTLCMPFSWRFSLEHPCSALSACPSPGGSHWSIPALHSLHALLLEVLTGAPLLCTLCMPFSWRFSLEHPCSELSACPSPGGSHWSTPALNSLHALLLEVLTGAPLL
ncbi:UNVERIFIED_CONTAM: hypothetical protein FKN15_068772 [Acipenser sinensis]